MTQELSHCSVAELSSLLARKEISAVELAQMYLNRIDQHRDLNAFLDVRPETTLAQARQADEFIAKGEATALTGIVLLPTKTYLSLRNGLRLRQAKCLTGI